ncbi:xylulokinase [Austwickia chelonae]|uniref:Putative carbohydrate kinase n=1 Tax=Austwickia chelonae NBRC 105200 TaxID=1184607 RepID=K6W4V0_9MICO|nr:FGGY-family carbohydrate kinase [Austwickia chelonae]GAB76847.1 putative carbohydrate kinase [Austwickia chelonae NBRC 105200]SEW31506.1 xylulokinase [Austwickia chelonae]
MKPVVLGIDIGTGSTKGVLVTADGTVVATARRTHRISLPHPGHVEMDAERQWWGDVTYICRELASPEHEVVAICVSGLGPAVVAVDQDWQALHPAVLYGIDTRAHEQIAGMTAELGEQEILRRCGKSLSSQAVGPKLRWLREHRDVPAAARWCSSHTFVAGRLTGRWFLDHHTASQCDPLYDVTAQEWAQDWSEKVLPGVRLPDLVWPAEVVGRLTPQAAAATGLPAGVPVVAGTVDAWAEAHSVGVHRPGDLMMMYGSTMFLVQVLPAPTVDAALWTTSGVTPESHTLAAGMSTSGTLLEWVSDLVSEEFAALLAEAEDVPAGSDGLVMLPYLAGERSPLYDSDARGVLAGLRLTHTRGHLFRAAHEGIAYGVRQILEVMERSAGAPDRVVAVGGGTRGGLWTQIVSDVCGIEQIVPETTTGASYGGALLAAEGVGLVPAGTSWMRTAGVVRPRKQVQRRYQELYRVYRDLYPSTRGSMHTLARLQECTD